MAINKVINSQSQEFQPVLTDTLVLDAVPTVNSFNSVTSDAVARAIAGASGEVPAVTEADNGKVLTAVYDEGGPAVEWADAQGGGAEYSAGTGISISAQDEISVDTTVIATKSDISGLQGELTAGTGINITNDTISVDTTVIATKSEIPVVPTVDTVYDATSTNPQAGTAVASAISTAVSGIEQVPSSSSADSGKVLTVDASGDPSWVTPSGGTQYSAGTGIDISAQNAISVDTTVVATQNDLSGIEQVPTVTSTDDGKVLTATYSGGTGSFAWAAAQGGSSYTFSNPIKETSGTVSLDYDTDTLSASTTSWTQFDTFNSSSSGQAVFRASQGDRLVDILNYGEPNSTISLHIPGNTYFSANYASSQSYFISLSTDSSIDRNPERTITYIGHPLATEQITVSDTTRTAVAEQDVVINFADLSDTSLWTEKQFNFTGYVYLAIVMDYSDTTSIANATLTSLDDLATVPVKYSATTAAPLTVKNPIPSFSTSTDAGKVLTVGSNGTEWVNSVPIEVVASLPASPTSGVLYIVTGS